MRNVPPPDQWDTDDGAQDVSLLHSENGTYKVVVDMDDAWGNDRGEAFVDVWIDGKHVGQYRSGMQYEGTLWTPVEIDAPSGKVRFINQF